MSTTATRQGARDSYFDLIRTLPLRAIRSERELDKAIAVLLKLETAKPESARDSGERDYIEMLAMLVQRYEQGRRLAALPAMVPADRLRFLMGEKGMNVRELGRVIGSQPGASLILHGRRSMSKAQILKLARYFAVSPVLFMEA
ncbi:MAG: type II toxin-antitoxin system HigA family antitoxin [Tepidisphaerales bacterium]